MTFDENIINCSLSFFFKKNEKFSCSRFLDSSDPTFSEPGTGLARRVTLPSIKGDPTSWVTLPGKQPNLVKFSV